MVHTGRESIKLAPPLSITEEALLDGIGVIDACIGIQYDDGDSAYWDCG